RLVAEGHSIDVVDDLSTGRLANLAEARAAARTGTGELRVHTLDVRAPELELLVARRCPDAVVHLAAPAARSSMTDMVSVIVGGTANVLNTGSRHGMSRFVLVAPSSIYDHATAKQLPITEAHPFAPRSVAVAAYLAAFELLRAASNAPAQQPSDEAAEAAVVPLEPVALVASSVYGPRSRRGLVAEMMGCRDEHRQFTLRGDAKRTRDLIFVDDVVDAVVRALTRGGRSWINVGTGTETSIAALAKAIGVETVLGEPVPGDRPRVALSPARAAVQLGWAPFTALAAGLATFPPAPERIDSSAGSEESPMSPERIGAQSASDDEPVSDAAVEQLASASAEEVFGGGPDDLGVN
ncbi:MAG: NAD-dependent epimerase/dehydratase family protein, partial [Acidimicrobiia bacterium]